MATLMAAFSIYIMWKSAELEIGWIPNEGPGGGAFPFWLGLGMLICCILTFIGKLRQSDESVDTQKSYMDKQNIILFALAAINMLLD